MHGVPIPPYRVRTNTGSGFLAIRIAILSCRTDGVRSRGSMKGVWGKHKACGGTEPAPLCSAIASLECNTSGLFYKGFPRVGWLQVHFHHPGTNSNVVSASALQQHCVADTDFGTS